MPSLATPSRLLRYALALVSISSLLFGIALSLGWELSFRVGRTLLTARDPVRPLLVSAGAAAALWSWSNGHAAPLLARFLAFARTRTGAIWIAFITLTVILFGIILPPYLQSAPRAYAIGDGAVLEMYTLHAAKGVWPLGPYSQFGWNHPGPLLFYLLLPFYSLSEYRSIAMHAGSFAINLASVVTIVVVLLRCATPAVACAGTAVLGLYVYRIHEIAGSYWNPHIVVLPVAALLMLSGRLASGRLSTLPAIALAGSFLAQTHVSLVPYVGLLAGAALVLALVQILGHAGNRLPANAPAKRHSIGWWINLTAWLMIFLWILPIAEELIHTPGNVTKMMRFFGEPYTRAPWDTIFTVWGEVISSPFRPGFHIPVGWPMTPAPGIILPALAIGQVLLLVFCARVAARRQDEQEQFGAAMCGLGALASLIALWSITRIRVLIGDYMVFWMSVIGALNWAIALGVIITPWLSTDRVRLAVRRAALAIGVLVIGGYLFSGIRDLESVRHRDQRSETDRLISGLSDDIDAYLDREHLGRPLFRVAQGAWGDGMGLVLDRYRRGVPIAVSSEIAVLCGAPLAPTHREDVVFVIADPAVHAVLTKRPGDILVAHRGGVYIHTGTDLDW
jgi:hypothetical protein